MPIDAQLLEFVVCPKCKGEVTVSEDPAGLACAACALLYPVQDDIPNLLIEDALPLGGAKGTGEAGGDDEEST